MANEIMSPNATFPPSLRALFPISHDRTNTRVVFHTPSISLVCKKKRMKKKTYRFLSSFCNNRTLCRVSLTRVGLFFFIFHYSMLFNIFLFVVSLEPLYRPASLRKQFDCRGKILTIQSNFISSHRSFFNFCFDRIFLTVTQHNVACLLP